MCFALPSEKGEIAQGSRTNRTLQPGRESYGLTHSWGKYQSNDRCSDDQGMAIVSRHKNSIAFTSMSTR